MLVFSACSWDGEYFSRDEPGRVVRSARRSRLWTVAADGTGLTALTTEDIVAEHPQATGDGRWIYFQTDQAGRWRIHRVRPDGSEMMPVVPADPGLSAFGARLSAKGRHFVWTAHDGETVMAFLSRADGGESTRIAPEVGYIYMASPDANGRQVVFSGPAHGYRLGLAAAPGWERRALAPDLPDAYVPQFMPDGRRILFTCRDGGLYLVNTDGTGLVRLTDRVQVEFFLSEQDQHGSTDVPAIAPDGARVALVRSRPDGPPQVAVVTVATGRVEELAELPGVCGRVKWSPDGAWLGCVCRLGRQVQLWILPAAGGTPWLVAPEMGAVVAFDWIPAA